MTIDELSINISNIFYDVTNILSLSFINDFGIIYEVKYDEDSNKYYPNIILKSTNIYNADKNTRKSIIDKYKNSIRKYNSWIDAHVYGLELIIFLIITIYIRKANILNKTNMHINYLNSEKDDAYIISIILDVQNEKNFTAFENKVIEKVNWTALANSFTRQIVSDWDD